MTGVEQGVPLGHVGCVEGQSRDPQELVSLGGSSVVLTDEQAAVVSAPLAPSLVVAGAGSGKTETLSLRFVYLLDHARSLFGRNLSPDEILCLTFTRKAAEEILERVRGLIDRVYGPDGDRPLPEVSTYNSYAASLVAEHGLRVGVDPESIVLTDASLWQLAARVAESWDGSLEFEGNLASAASAIPSLASSLADHGVTVEEFSDFLGRITGMIEGLPLGSRSRSDAKRERLAAPFHSRVSLAVLIKRFNETKKEASSLDFSDQIAIATRLAGLPAVQALEQARYRAVLLDEFQDTSPGQLDLFATLFGPDHSVMAVGDPHQAIYGFRGASEAALERFVRCFGVGDRQRLTLSVSWRNSTAVLEAANAATVSLRQDSSVGVPLLRSRTEAEGIEELPRNLPAVTAQTYSDPEAEATGLVALLIERRTALETQRPSGEIVESAILCRMRRLFPTIVSALRAAGIDYQVVGLGGLLDTPAVVELIALLQVAHDPSRGDSLMRLLTSERISLGVRDLAAFGAWSEELAGSREEREVEPSIIDALDELPPEGWVSRDGRDLGEAARVRLAGLRATVEAIRSRTYLPLTELILEVARTWNLDIEARVAARERGTAGGDEAIYALMEAAKTFSAAVDHATLGAFLAWLEAAYEREDGLDAPLEESRKGAVQVQTIHAAKGMEWDVVAVPGLVDGVFPKVDVSGKPDDPIYRSAGWLVGAGVLPWPLRRDHEQLPSWEWERASNLKEFEDSEMGFREAAARHAIAEERRLFYVAVTRARSDVILTASPRPKQRPPRPVSIFLRDLVSQGVLREEMLTLPQKDEVAKSEGEVARMTWPVDPTTFQVIRRGLAAEVREAIAVRDSIASGTAGHTGELPYAREIEAMMVEAGMASPPEVLVDSPTHLSSTDLVRLARDREAFTLSLRRPMPTEPTAVASRGGAFHSFVERYFRMPALIDPDGLLEDDSDDDGAGEADKSPGGSSLEELRVRFLESEWSRRLPEAVEVDVEMPLGGMILRCRIDAVFPPGAGLEKVTVVDWKTGRSPSDPDERASREVQLAVYRLAWASRKGLAIDDVDAVFVYIASGETVRPTKLLGEAEIVALIRDS